jgi:hypothetical protein
MVERERRRRYRWMTPTAFYMSFVAVVLLMLAVFAACLAVSQKTGFQTAAVLLSAGLLAGLVGIALHQMKKSWTLNFDPNDRPMEARKKMGMELAASKEEFLTMNSRGP